jgi:EAL domain-containing protein (putative c-di-GMP-specific phosphodiesterase class I)
VLKNLHFDSIKLDKEFLSGFEDSPFAKKVIEGTVKMIKTLGINTVAEGVETREQSDFLRGIGCDLAQGYFFSRPLRASTFEQLLKENKKGA